MSGDQDMTFVKNMWGPKGVETAKQRADKEKRALKQVTACLEVCS